MSKQEADSASAVVGGAFDSVGNAIASGTGSNGYSKPVPLEIHLPWHLTLSVCQVRRRTTLERETRPREACDGYAGSFLMSPAADCQKLAGIFAFFYDKAALMDAEDAIRAVGELVWIRQGEGLETSSVAARPALVVYAGNGAACADRIETVPPVAAGDPLLQHMALVLQTKLQANTADSHLYAELLADALAVHFISRYAGANPHVRQLSGGLPPFKLKRVVSYINEHLEQELSLTQLAGVVQTSVAHFARLFRQATGSTPHHYVLACRVERAKRLLVETNLSLSEVAQRVGFADQSHLTALFRIHTATTPKVYRVSTKQ